METPGDEAARFVCADRVPAGRNQRWLLRLGDVADAPRPFLSAANAYRSLHGLLGIEKHLNEPVRVRVPLILLAWPPI